MLRILVFVNNISQTSIPFETAVQIAKQETCEITVMTFYSVDREKKINTNRPIEVRYLDAESRLDFDAWRDFYREIQSGQYDVLHTHHNFSGSIARAIAATSEISIIDTEHRQHSSYTALQNVVNAPTLPLADRVVCNSKATQNSLRWYERRLIDDDKLSVVYNGVNLNRLSNVVGDVDKSNTGPSVVTVGRLVPVKNYETLLEAFSLVREQVPDATLSLVGDGPLRADLEAQSAALGLADAVQFKGEISRTDVYRELAHADLFTIPSRAEGFCVAAVEAMATGLPVVVSDISVFHEVVGEPGVFADPNDSAAFADAISELLQSPERRRKLGKEARNRSHEQFSLKQTAHEYYNIYKEAAKTSNQ